MKMVDIVINIHINFSTYLVFIGRIMASSIISMHWCIIIILTIQLLENKSKNAPTYHYAQNQLILKSGRSYPWHSSD